MFTVLERVHMHPFKLIFAALVITFQGASGYGGQRTPRDSLFLRLENCHVDLGTIYMEPEATPTTNLKMSVGIQTGSYSSVWAQIRSISDRFLRRVR